MVNLMLKDLGLALETAKTSDSSVPMGALAQSLYSMLKHTDTDQGSRDFSSILKMFQ
jgi:3-hydroxyisobutyrate dehydrogenase